MSRPPGSDPDHAILDTGERIDVRRSEESRRWGVYSRREEGFRRGSPMARTQAAARAELHYLVTGEAVPS